MVRFVGEFDDEHLSIRIDDFDRLVYAYEARAIEKAGERTIWVDGCVERHDAVVKTLDRWLRELWAQDVSVIEDDEELLVGYSRHRSTAFGAYVMLTPGAAIIAFSRDRRTAMNAMTDRLLLHELAHIAVGDGCTMHGQEWQEAYVDLASRLGFNRLSEELRKAFDDLNKVEHKEKLYAKTA